MRFLILQWLLHVNCPCLAYYADVIQCVCVRVTLLCSGGSKVMSESQLIDLWERIDAQVGELLEGCEPLPPPPMTFDPTNDITFDEQKLVSFPPSLFHSPSPFLSLSHTHTHTHTHTQGGTLHRRLYSYPRLGVKTRSGGQAEITTAVKGSIQSPR